MVIIATGNTPLPIPNREVKTVCADGTAICGRVGNCQREIIIGKTKSTASQNEKYKKCRLISVYVKLKRHSFLV